MKDKIKKNKKIIIAAISSIFFLLILIDVLKYDITPYDKVAHNIFVESLRNDTLTQIMKVITFFGSGIMLISLAIIVFIFYKNKKESLYLSINLLISFLLNNLIKVIVQRPRPSGYNLVKENNYSFPSSHSMISMAFYGFIIYLIYKHIKNKKKKYVYISSLILLIILICISRIYLGVHYLSDTLGGVTLAITYLIIFIEVKGKIHDKEKNKN